MMLLSVEKALLVSRPMLYRTITIYRDKTFVYATWLLFLVFYGAIYAGFAATAHETIGIKCILHLHYGTFTCRLYYMDNKIRSIVFQSTGTVK